MDKYPTPFWDGECWKADLRGKRWGNFGRPTLDVPRVNTPEVYAEARAATIVKWFELRERAEAQSRQVRLDFTGAPKFAELCDELAARRSDPEKEKLTPDNLRYVVAQLRWIKADLGHLFVTAFHPPVGDQLLKDYVVKLANHPYKPASRSNRLCAIRQVLELAWDKNLMPKMPRFPKAALPGERMREPVWWWQSEGDFRVLRDHLWEDHDRPGHPLLRIISLPIYPGVRFPMRSRELRLDYIARRKLYLSNGYYSGMHTRNLDTINDGAIGPDTGTWVRTNTKSAGCVPEVTLKMPEQWWLDVQEEINRLGRFWHHGEAIAGGPWGTVADVCMTEGRRLNLPLPISPRVWRRSVARNLALLGWSEADAVEWLGHVDRRMVETVYRRIPVDQRSPIKLPWTNESMRTVGSRLARTAVVFDFQKARPGTALHSAEPLQSLKAEAAGEPAGPEKPSTHRRRR